MLKNFFSSDGVGVACGVGCGVLPGICAWVTPERITTRNNDAAYVDDSDIDCLKIMSPLLVDYKLSIKKTRSIFRAKYGEPQRTVSYQQGNDATNWMYGIEEASGVSRASGNSKRVVEKILLLLAKL